MTTTELKTNLLSMSINEVEKDCKTMRMEDLATLVDLSEKMLSAEYFALPEELWDEEAETGNIVPGLVGWYALRDYKDAIYNVFFERVQASAILPKLLAFRSGKRPVCPRFTGNVYMLKDNLFELDLTSEMVGGLNPDELWMLGKVCLEINKAVTYGMMDEREGRPAIKVMSLVLHAMSK